MNSSGEDQCKCQLVVMLHRTNMVVVSKDTLLLTPWKNMEDYGAGETGWWLMANLTVIGATSECMPQRLPKANAVAVAFRKQKTVSKASNHYAAMPSMHAGYSLWCSLSMYEFSPFAIFRSLAVVSPFFTLYCIVVTVGCSS